jgi:hypothetical protein
MDDRIVRGIQDYVKRYKAADTQEYKDNICREVGHYLNAVTLGENDFMLYASEFLKRINEDTFVDRIKKSLEDWL